MLHSYFGNKNFDNAFTKVINKIINPYLKKVTDIDYDINFVAKSRPGNDDEYFTWIVEVDSDVPLPRTFKYNDEYKKKKNVDGFHHNVLSYEIRELLPNMGVDKSGSFIKFTNLK